MNEWSMNEPNCQFKTFAGCWYSLPATLHTGEGEWHKAGRLCGSKRSPSSSSSLHSGGYLWHKCFNSKETLMCFSGILPVWPINILIRKSQKLLNSLQAESLKSKRGLSSAHSSSGLQKGTVPVNTAASEMERERRRHQRIHTYRISYSIYTNQNTQNF